MKMTRVRGNSLSVRSSDAMTHDQMIGRLVDDGLGWQRREWLNE